MATVEEDSYNYADRSPTRCQRAPSYQTTLCLAHQPSFLHLLRFSRQSVGRFELVYIGIITSLCDIPMQVLPVILPFRVLLSRVTPSRGVIVKQCLNALLYPVTTPSLRILTTMR